MPEQTMTAPASLRRRLGAMLYDSLLVLALLFAVTVPIVVIRDGEPIEPANAGYQLLLVAVAYAFFVGFWYRFGRTLGMQSWQLQIETPDGTRPTLGALSVRFLAAIISLLPLGLGFFWQLVDRDGLAWHDRLSDTRLRRYPKRDKG